MQTIDRKFVYIQPTTEIVLIKISRTILSRSEGEMRNGGFLEE